MDSLSGLQSQYIITCPYCNRNIRSDSIECPLCGMFVPEDIRKIIASTAAMDKNHYKKCPYCAEDIKREAIKCKHCGSMLDGVLPLYEDKINIDDPKNLTITTTQDEPLEKGIIKTIETEVSAPKDPEMDDPLQKMDMPNEHIFKWWELLGLTLLPYIFAWFTLRKGYTRKEKIIAFGWMFISALLVFINLTNEPIPVPKPLSREAQIQVYKDKQTSLATQFQNSKQGYYSAGLSVSKTDDFSEQMKRIQSRDSHVVNMRKIKTEYASLEKEVTTFNGGALPNWWHGNEKRDSDKWDFVFKLEAL